MKTKKIAEMSSEELITLIKQLKKRKKYGLVWESKPEDVVEQCLKQLPVLHELPKKGIYKNPNKNVEDANIIIEGDNYHSLSILNYTHAGKIDVIYIDPPFNTGAKDWKYNNNFVDSNDKWRHSKWINMMYRRIQLAKNLLSKKGFLICAIDENELHNLRHILDDVFGEKNKVGTITVLHNPKGRNLAKFFSENSEFMLVYAKDAITAEFNTVAIDEDKKESFDLSDEKGNYRLESFMRIRTSWSRSNKPSNYYPIYVAPDLKTLTLNKKRGYFQVYPKTNDGREWAWKNIKKTFNELNKDGYFAVKRNKNKITIYHKYREQQVFKNVWTDKKYFSEFNGTNLLKKMFGKVVFDYPKSLYLVEDILKITSNKNSVILDFFAGSGTTGHAVLTLNEQDGGKRKFILCTNNEGSIASDVCYPRIKKAIEGYAGVKGIPSNLRYYKTAFVFRSKVSDDTRRELVSRSTEMICIKENTFEKIVDRVDFKVYRNGGHTAGLLLDLDSLDDFKNKLLEQKLPTSIYVFSLTNDDFSEDFEDLDVSYKIHPIPESILEVYRKLFK